MRKYKTQYVQIDGLDERNIYRKWIKDDVLQLYNVSGQAVEQYHFEGEGNVKGNGYIPYDKVWSKDPKKPSAKGYVRLERKGNTIVYYSSKGTKSATITFNSEGLITKKVSAGDTYTYSYKGKGPAIAASILSERNAGRYRTEYLTFGQFQFNTMTRTRTNGNKLTREYKWTKSQDGKHVFIQDHGSYEHRNIWYRTILKTTYDSKGREIKHLEYYYSDNSKITTALEQSILDGSYIDGSNSSVRIQVNRIYTYDE